MKKSNLVVMLTHNDYTVKNAINIFEECKHLPVNYWGAKEQGISPQELKALFFAFKENKKTTMLEVVAYNEKECLDGARLASECGCDILLGTVFFDSVYKVCRDNNIKYMPFVGDVSGRPSVLEGTAAAMLSQTEQLKAKGVYGVDLLGYRYSGSCYELCRSLLKGSSLPLCLAGSINTVQRLDEVISLKPDFFTVGSAFFENAFGDSIPGQIQFVCDYIKAQEKHS